MTDQNHYHKIDFLRGVAIIYVFIFHYQSVLFEDAPLEYSQSGVAVITNFNRFVFNFSPTAFGFTGVTLFLIISGFLIHLGYLKNKEVFDSATFFSKRFWRIFPPYWFVLFAFTIMLSHYNFAKIDLRNLVFHFFTIHNLFDSTFFSTNPSFWSLALEVQLYLLYPVFLIMRKKFGIKSTFKIILSLSIFLLLLGINLNLIDKLSYNYSVFKQWFIWGAGAYFAELFYNKKRMFNKDALVIALISFILLIAAKSFLYTNYTLQYIATLAWIAFVDWFLYNDKIDLKGTTSKWIIKVGICSYSIYLIHQILLPPIFNFYNKYIKTYFDYPVLTIIPAFLLIFGLSYLLYIFLERPSISIGEYLRKKRTVVKKVAVT